MKKTRRKRVQLRPFQCQFLEFLPKQWLYAVETEETRILAGFNYGLWDWREFAVLEGPFDSRDEAKNHQRKNHPEAEIMTVQEYDVIQMGKISHLLKIKIGQLFPKELTNGTRELRKSGTV